LLTKKKKPDIGQELTKTKKTELNKCSSVLILEYEIHTTIIYGIIKEIISLISASEIVTKILSSAIKIDKAPLINRLLNG
jgi:hypothetical protein